MKKKYVETKSVQDMAKLFHLSDREKTKIEIRIALAVAITKCIEKKGLTHLQASKMTGIGRTVITAIVNGNLAKISTDRLIDVAEGLGLHVHLKVA
ncbi:MAG: XRE family transcriptional regulator [Pseudomonadota bacterium]